jgi:iron uptake system component EfeO
MTLRTLALPAAVAALTAALAGCGGDGVGAKSDGRKVQVKLTDAGCDPARLELAAGPVTFDVANTGADEVTEFEILDGGRVVGEVENIASGLERSFSMTLEPGRYVTYCPGGTSAERGTLVVTGKAPRAAAASPEVKAAVAAYRRYVESQTGLLVTRTRDFVEALGSGDVAAAKKLYVTARIPYESIEPVAESFGPLDPAIDAREGDVPAAKWTGFHPIEQMLWVRKTTQGSGKLAAQLLKDVLRLQQLARKVELEPAAIANGSVELLGEVSKSKITGEEERYSHVDLVDFEANVKGAKAAFDSVRPIVAKEDRELAQRIDGRFRSVFASLEPYRRGSGFVSYPALTKQDTRRLSRAIDSLAEPLSEVAAIVVTAR